MANTEWPVAGRIVHLHGGCRAANLVGPEVILEPDDLTGRGIGFTLEQYGSLYAVLERFGFKIIGVDFFTNKLEIDGIMPPEWRPYHRTSRTAWGPAGCHQNWRNIAHAAFEAKNAQLWDIASKVSYQLNACFWRLREISASYYNQLMARTKSGSFKSGNFFKDGNTVFIYLAIQTFLVDACILRDYIAEFISKYICSTKWELEPLELATMSQLKKKILDKHDKPEEIFQILKASTRKDGWLELLGSYRDLVVHSAPLAQAEKMLFIESGLVNLDGGKSLPRINCFIPGNPSDAMKVRSQGKKFENFEKWVKEFAGPTKDVASKIDGLDYAWETLANLTAVSELVAKASPVAPKMMTIDISKMKGPIRFKRI